MIQDIARLAELQQEWLGVRKTQSRLQALLNVGGVGTPHSLRDWTHNLVLLFAFSVLESVLIQLRDEGNFNSTSHLKTLMHKSKTSLVWVDFAKVDGGRERRNTIAHRQQVYPRDEIWEYIDAIEKELLDWGIMDTPIQFEH